MAYDKRKVSVYIELHKYYHAESKHIKYMISMCFPNLNMVHLLFGPCI